MKLEVGKRYLFKLGRCLYYEALVIEISPSGIYVKLNGKNGESWNPAESLDAIEELPCHQDGELFATKDEWKERALTPCPDIVAGTGVMAVDFDKLVNQTDPPGTHH